MKTLSAGLILTTLVTVFVVARCTPPTEPPLEESRADQPPSSASATVTSTVPAILPPSPSPTQEISGLLAYLDLEHQAWLVNSDGSEPRPLNLCTEEVTALAWSPDGRSLAYACSIDDTDRGRAGIYTLSTGDHYPIGQPVWALSQLTWSPSGCHLGLDGGTSIARNLTIINMIDRQVTAEMEAIGYAWSPEGDALLFGRRHPLKQPLSLEPSDSVSLAVFPLNGREPTILLEGTSEALYFPKAWLPDDRLLYERLNWDEEQQRAQRALWTVTYANGALGVSQPAEDVPLIYDREKILERLPERFQNATTGGFSWSPDGQWLTFYAGAEPDMAVYLIDWQKGHAPHKLAPGTSPLWQPSDVSVRCSLP